MEPGSIEAVGDAVTGGLVARAVEPKAGEGAAAGKTCLNCGTALIGPHCHICGQKAQVHRTLTAWWHDFLHGVLHLDGKLWRTLPLLAWRPGELTRRYVEGERARFVSPLALFLFSVFLMFAIFTTVGGPFGQFSTEIPPEARREFEAERQAWQAELTQLETRRARMAAGGQDLRQVDVQIASLRQRLSVVQLARQTPEGGLNINMSEQPSDIDWLNRAYRKAKENPSLLIYKLQNNAYKFSWALIPISVPFVWLLFLHRRRYRQYKAYDHTVFVTYSIGFMTLMTVFFSLARAIGLPGDLAVMAIMLIPPVHMYRQLRGAYLLSRLSALWRTLVLLWFAFIAATLFFLLLLALGILA